MIRAGRLHPLTIIWALLLGLAVSPVSHAAASRYFVTSDGARLHYQEAGTGYTLVFVPGWTMPGDIWRAQVDHFAKAYRVVAFDPRGQGKSEITPAGYTVERRARDIEELLAAVGDESVVLIGWSLGVLESLAYVGAYGTRRLAAVVLVDNSIGEEPPPVSDPTFLTRLRKERTKTVDRFVRSMYRQPQSEKYLKGIVAAALRTPLQASVDLLSYPYPRERWREMVYQIDRPLSYIVTSKFEGQARNLKKNRPDAWVEIFPTAGHALFVDEPARFNDYLSKFITSASRH
ncbi:MAG: alpha/beta hydrolase [Pseudomonadota bacterium]|nr:MAG: alpha/beta hydrolase [Pseudomonadota bacterium]